VAEVIDVIEDEDEQLDEGEHLDDIDEDDLLDEYDDETPIEEEPFDLSADEILEQERNLRLSERFQRYLGVVERRYNKYLLIPKGAYIIGSDEPEKDELTQQTITLPEYFVGKFPVTNSLFEIFVEQTGYQTIAEEKGYGIVYQGRYQKRKDENTGRSHFIWNAAHQWRPVEGAYWYQPNGPGSNLHNKRFHPVVQISLKDAMAFAAWVGKRLPKEAEWEAAARTQKGCRYPWGEVWKDGMCNTEDTEIADTTPVDHYPDADNELGVSDLLGNTLEWTSESCEPPFKASGQKDYHIAKGGSWISDQSIRLYARFKLPIHFTSNLLGFRCIAD
jgi:formylglycine-generating enzyme required for sulfatase activity